jgi:hypothetical protein
MPFPILAAGIGAAAGGVLNALMKTKKQKYSMNDLVKYGYQPYDATEEINNVGRITDMNLAKERYGRMQKAEQYGLDPVRNTFAGDAAILESQQNAISTIRERARNEKNKISKLLFDLNEGQGPDTSPFQDFIEGAIPGASLGISAYNAFYNPESEPGAITGAYKASGKNYYNMDNLVPGKKKGFF